MSYTNFSGLRDASLVPLSTDPIEHLSVLMLMSDTAERQTPEMRIYWNRFSYNVIEIVCLVRDMISTVRQVNFPLKNFLAGTLLAEGVFFTYMAVNSSLIWMIPQLFFLIVGICLIWDDPKGK